LSDDDFARAALAAALATAFVESVARRCDLVEPIYALVRLDDHDDNAFLSLAHAAKARYLVTGDGDFIAARFRLADLSFSIVTPR
jgi:predicted nucleic acid-binding protein